MPEEIVAIIIVSIVAGTFMSFVKMILKYRSERFVSHSGDESSLTRSELEAMIRRAVAEATKPLAERIEELTETLEEDAPRLTGLAPDLLEGADAFEPEEAPEPVRRRARRRSG
ncbi:hypothetical protein [Rhodocaloribacter sp.]